MSLRSITGCYLCKSKRKKCDETKPRCLRQLRCIRRGENCEYEYIESSGTKRRTRPAPRPASELVNKAPKDPLDLVTSPQHPNTTVGSIATEAWYQSLPGPLLESVHSVGMDWEATLYQPAATLSLSTFPFQAEAEFPCSDSEQFIAPQNLNPDQASLFNSLLSLEKANSHAEHNFTSSSAPMITHTTPDVDLGHHMSQPSWSNTYDSFSFLCGPDINYFGDDENDPEGVGEVLCQVPVRLDPIVDSNSLAFVLQSYARWMPLVVFDPLIIASATQEGIIRRFLDCPGSRSRLLLVSNVMRRLAKSWNLDEGGKMTLSSLRDQVWQNVINYRSKELPPTENERKRANAALDQLIELVVIHLYSSPLVSTIRLLQSAAAVFLSACPAPHLPNMLELLLEADMNVRLFAGVDVVISITTGRPLLCRYDVPWSLEICDRFIQKREDQGLRWLGGIPDQFILLFGFMSNIRENAIATKTEVDTTIIQQIEEDIKNAIIAPCDSRDPSLGIGRMVVQECWREVVFIFLYMAVCGLDAFDQRVERAQRRFMKLMKGIKPGRHPDAFLVIPTILVGVATTRSSHRQTITSRIFSRPEFSTPNTAVNDYLRILEDIWARTQVEGRAARWEDLREACRRVTGV
ncbi:hypothetical protein RSOLAG1IB_11683 [Rhizoctonia solani AG-1 IB]|uniref:Zn(2)-C6 fungal-type domain-containing protein n=1 Tax=Thanatephorus cucumeris (strain AG1-IB / isolate 7/3/14) TaxID=1108050 RepID=A0A0B7F8N1_THACB|nr:hypothetical protein RSOLAG1IB_11683 [Rhizoctonia solani AG-1 IB]